ncbi:MAG: hypothetical protein ACP6IS_05500 [Candidatus Asgardarchaeia archaeon]
MKLHSLFLSDKARHILMKIREEKHISPSNLQALKELYGARFINALSAVKENAVKKYIFLPSGVEIWIVVGKKKDYLILGDYYCSCIDFLMNVVIKKNRSMCYHLLAKLLAESLNRYEIFRLPDTYYKRFISEWRE